MSGYSGRHRGAAPPSRLPVSMRTARAAVPTAAVATLAISGTGASVAAQDGNHFASSATGAMTVARADNVADTTVTTTANEDVAELSARRSAAAQRASLLEGRAQERQRIARNKERAAKAKEEAKAKKAMELGQNWVFPVAGGAPATSGFGARWGRAHEGNDFAVPMGTPLRAMSGGQVVWAGPMGAFGNLVKIRYWDGTVSFYGHMNSVATVVGASVLPGDVVGYSGNTGRSTGPHLHLEVHQGDGPPQDPTAWMAARGVSNS